MIWLDPSNRLDPFGAIPPWLTGCEALVIPAPGEPPRVDRTPERSAVAEGREISLRVVLAADGGAEVTGTDRYLGFAGAVLKAQLEPLDATARRQAVEGLLSSQFRGIEVAAVSFVGEDDPEAPLELRWRAHAAQLARAVEGGLVLESALFPARLGARYVQVAARTTSLLVQSAERTEGRVEIVAPAGLRVEVGESRSVVTPYGTYARSERALDGTGLLREERLEVRRGRIAPERYLEFTTFASAVDGLQEEAVRLTR